MKYLCGLGRLDTGDFGFFDGHDARLEVVLVLGLVGGDLPVGVDIFAGLAVEALAVGDDEELVAFNTAKNMLEREVSVVEMNEEHLESFAGLVIGAVKFVDLGHNVIFSECLFKDALDLFNSAGLVRIANAEGSGRHIDKSLSLNAFECV